MDIQLNQVSKQFNGKIIFSNMNITFPEAKISCLMGASGAGKTTVVNIIMGLLNPDCGEVTGVNGKRIAAVFQEDRLIEHWDALKNVKLVCDNTVTEEKIVLELRQLGLEDCQDKPVRNYSGGMRRRTAIVRALMAKSDILILDEPFRGMDTELKYRVIEYLKQNTQGKTVIVVTHDKEDVRLLEAKLIMI